MNRLFPSHLANVSASIGDKLHFGGKRDEKPRFLQVFGRGSGDRKDNQRHKACALYALQPPPSTNWNKWNKRQLRPPQVGA